MTSGRVHPAAGRVPGATPFAIVGRPSAVAVSRAWNVVVVGGSDHDHPQWPLPGLGGRPAPYRIGVFALDDTRCLHLFPSRRPVNAVAIHPRLPLAAIGTGSYDGGYLFEGELLILHLLSGKATSVLSDERDIVALSWGADDTLDGVMTPPSEGDGDRAFTHGYPFSFVWDDWTKVPYRAFPATDQFGPLVPYATLGGPAPEQVLAEIAADAGPARP